MGSLPKSLIRSNDGKVAICPFCRYNEGRLDEVDKWLAVSVSDVPAVDCILYICADCYHKLQKISVDQHCG